MSNPYPQVTLLSPIFNANPNAMVHLKKLKEPPSVFPFNKSLNPWDFYLHFKGYKNRVLSK